MKNHNIYTSYLFFLLGFVIVLSLSVLLVLTGSGHINEGLYVELREPGSGVNNMSSDSFPLEGWIQFALYCTGIVFSFFLCKFVSLKLFPMILAFACWMIFQPGIFTADSLSICFQAVKGTFNDWHPAVMAVSLNQYLSLGGPFKYVILIQLLLGFYGVFLWVRTLGLVLYNAKYAELIAAILLILFSLPLTPFTTFMSTLSKDAWLCIDFLWLSFLSIEIVRHRTEDRNRFVCLSGLLLFIVIATHSVLLRHNVIILIPLYALCFYNLSNTLKKHNRFLSTVSFVVILLAVNGIFDKRYNVQDQHAEQSVMGLELVGLAYAFPSVIDEFPYTKSQLKTDFAEHFKWAGYRYMRWGRNPYVKPSFVQPRMNQNLRNEYSYAVRHHWLRLMYVKFMNFIQLLNPLETTEWFALGIEPNRLGIRRDDTFLHLRQFYKTSLLALYQIPPIRVLNAMNLTWLIFGTTVSLTLFFQQKKQDRKGVVRTGFILSLIPIVYTASYGLACPWKAYRYLYPVTLPLQCIAGVFTWFYLKPFIRSVFSHIHHQNP